LKLPAPGGDLAFIKERLSNEEEQALNEEKDVQLPEDDLEWISDNEGEDNLAILQDQPVTQGLSERATGKRRKSFASNSGAEGQEAALFDDEAELSLHDTQQRVSGRNRKRSRRDDDQFVHYLPNN
jgi:hypothetical protein